MTEPALILVADDDADIRNLICIRLERSGYRCLTAADGAEALRLALEDPPDLCIVDVVMPDRDGFEVVEALRGDPGTTDVPVVMLTASVQERERQRALDLGVNAFLSKPFDFGELQAQVVALLPAR